MRRSERACRCFFVCWTGQVPSESATNSCKKFHVTAPENITLCTQRTKFLVSFFRHRNILDFLRDKTDAKYKVHRASGGNNKCQRKNYMLREVEPQIYPFEARKKNTTSEKITKPRENDTMLAIVHRQRTSAIVPLCKQKKKNISIFGQILISQPSTDYRMQNLIRYPC